jgi:hypothetical protein
VLVKKMGLDLLCGYEGRQDDTSFLITIAFTKELLNASESIPDPSIPAERASPVITGSAALAFRKHGCENTP